MNNAEDKYDNDEIHESLLPYAPPAIIDEESDELDTSLSPDDLREIAILLNRETTFWRYAMLTCFSIMGICSLTVTSFFVLTKEVAIMVFCIIICLPVSLGMCIGLAFAIYATIQRHKIQKRISRKRCRRYNDPLDQAVRLLNTAGYKAKFHRIIDLTQFEHIQESKKVE